MEGSPVHIPEMKKVISVVKSYSNAENEKLKVQNTDSLYLHFLSVILTFCLPSICILIFLFILNAFFTFYIMILRINCCQFLSLLSFSKVVKFNLISFKIISSQWVLHNCLTYFKILETFFLSVRYYIGFNSSLIIYNYDIWMSCQKVFDWLLMIT